MRQAGPRPILRCDCGQSRWWLWLVRGLQLLSCASVLAWCLSAGGETHQWHRTALASLACLCIAVSFRHPFMQDGQLGMDPTSGWWLCPSESACEAAATDEVLRGQLAVALDLGASMLLRFRPLPGSASSSVRWLAVDRAAAPATWQDLRRAVYSARFNTDSSPAVPAIRRATR